MGRFLKKLVVFFLLVILACVGLELLLLTRPNVYSYKREFLERHLEDITVLLMGNSHIEEALVPELLGDSVFNFAISGKEWSCDVELAQRYLPKMNRLRIVVLPFSYEYFEFGRTRDGVSTLQAGKRANTFRCMQTKYLGIRQYGWRYWSEILNSDENYMKRLFSCQSTSDFCDSLGFVKLGVQGRSSYWQWQRLPEIVDPNMPRDEKAFEEFVRGHDTIAQLCREQGARLILVSAPVYQTYQYRISDVVLQEMKLVADSLNKLYHNVEYYNFFFAEGFDDEDFYDSGHLTETGAIKFSKMLSDTISLHFSFGNPEKSLYLCTDF
ncbi:MAG: hypothetical protein K5920_03660 [Bacteroidales bacterium]|nr:hypothetical protein [Bacteroidales bacterium]